MDMLKALILGFVEGFTEFLPVSSTGHLLLIGHFIGFESKGKTFEILVQFGAILAIVTVYFWKLIDIAKGMLTDKTKRNFVIAVVVAFIPAMIVGFFARDFIKTVLFKPEIVCITLIAGGLVLLVIDELKLEGAKDDVMQFTLPMAAKIGCFQVLAMIPGVSRSGATIVGAMLMGASKKAAAEFSFFLAMPTMAGAFFYDLLKSYKLLTANDALLITIGFMAAFVSGLLVVRGFLGFISKHGFTPFAWWRIVVGCAGLAGLWVFG
ncbi:MAG: undecaprenyl-diphosphate phosphatase [Beijerinckiaceae bacterium]